MPDRYGPDERDELRDEIAKLTGMGRQGYKSQFSVMHPKVTFYLSSEFKDFRDQATDKADEGVELAIVARLLESARGRRGWRLQEDLRSFYSYGEIKEGLESLERKGLIHHRRTRSS